MTDRIELEDLVDQVLLQAPQCPTVVAARAMQRACRDFYRETHAWVEPLPEYVWQEDQMAMSVVPVVGTVIQRIQGLDVVPQQQTLAWRFLPPNRIVFDRAPKADSRVIPHAVCNLTITGMKVPCDHANRFLDTWEHGALWYLRQQAGQPWYGPEDGDYHRQLFKGGIVNARNELEAHYLARDLKVKPRKFI